MNIQDAWKKQQEILERLEKDNPLFLSQGKTRNEDDVFQEIGMHAMPKNRPESYLRFYPEDFIVEEVTDEGQVITVNSFSDEVIGERSEKVRTLYAHLIKAGIPTHIAVKNLSTYLDIPENKIGTSGLKDSDAITAQRIAFPKVRLTPDEMRAVHIPNLTLTHFSYDKGSLNPGNLKGNRFTITLRTNAPVDTKDLTPRIQKAAKNGILNYYQAQRFGGQRLMTHEFGKLLFQGKPATALREFLFHTSEYESYLTRHIREEAKKNAHDWKVVEEIFQQLPYTFQSELRAVGYLRSAPKNYIGALYVIKDQVTLWAYAYASLLFNKYISENEDSLPESIPLVTSPFPEEYEIYNKYLEEDGTKNFIRNLREIKFIVPKSRMTPTRVFPQNASAHAFEDGVTLRFELAKGSYATTFLSNFFTLTQTPEIPEWCGNTRIDPLELIGDGTLTQTKEVLKDYINYKENHHTEQKKSTQI